MYIYIKHQHTKAYMFIRNPIPVDKHKKNLTNKTDDLLQLMSLPDF